MAKGKPRVNLSQEALQVLSEKDQEKLLSEGTQYLLTPEALRKHDILTGVLELRQFACEKCDHVWWRTVSRIKAVAKCNHCHVKYDALPRDKEFGIGRYRCTNCNHSFFSRCEATSERPCFNCDNTVRTPYIHPKFKPTHRTRQPVDPTTVPYIPPGSVAGVSTGARATPYAHAARMYRKKVVNASQVHDSTGSTASTFITQIERPYYVPEDDPFDDDISVVISDPESDEEEIRPYESSTEFESDSELSSIAHEASIDHSSVASDVDSTAGAIGSSSGSDSDSDDMKPPQEHTDVPVDDLQSVSSDTSSAKDSGLGIAEVASSTAEKSSTSTQGILHIIIIKQTGLFVFLTHAKHVCVLKTLIPCPLHSSTMPI